MSDAPPDALRPWPELGSRPGPELMVCKARFDTLENPRTGAEMERVVLETPNWVNVVALTADQQVVMVRQYRFGTRALALEIPGGVVDPGEEPFDAAVRELREETGHTTEDWSALGSVEANPAFQDNTCFHFLARGAAATSALEQDPGEDLEVVLVPLADVPSLIREGTITHSLVVCALARVLDLRLEPLP